MTAIISSTYDKNYWFFVPIVSWLWNKIGVDVICFTPVVYTTDEDFKKWSLLMDTIEDNNIKCTIYDFYTEKHKAATYAQTVRLYAACLTLPENEVLITSDCDMGVFGDYLKQFDGNIQLFGADLLEGEKMYPMCYCSATVKQWRQIMNIDYGEDSYQDKLDSTLGVIETDHFRGNYWCFDQENLYNGILKSGLPVTMYPRAKLPERFASRRLDRDDSFLMERDVTDIIDFHFPRPGHEHIENTLTIFKRKFPDENFDWIRTFTEQYKALL